MMEALKGDERVQRAENRMNEFLEKTLEKEDKKRKEQEEKKKKKKRRIEEGEGGQGAGDQAAEGQPQSSEMEVQPQQGGTRRDRRGRTLRMKRRTSRSTRGGWWIWYG